MQYSKVKVNLGLNPVHLVNIHKDENKNMIHEMSMYLPLPSHVVFQSSKFRGSLETSLRLHHSRNWIGDRP